MGTFSKQKAFLKKRRTRAAAALFSLSAVGVTIFGADAVRVDEDAAVTGAEDIIPVEFAVRLKTPLRADVMMSCPNKMHSPVPFPYEFGWEVNIGVPHAYYLHKCGRLEGTVSCNISLADYYWFSPKHKIVTCGPVAGFYASKHMKYEGVGVDEYLLNKQLPYWERPPHKEYYTSMSVTPRAVNANAIHPPADPFHNSAVPHVPSLEEAEAALAKKKPLPLVNPFTGTDFSKYGGASTRMQLKWPNRGNTGIAILNKQHHDWEEKEKGYLDADVLKQILVLLSQKCPGTEVMYYRNWAFVHDEAGTINEGTVDSKGMTESQALASHHKMTTLKSVSEQNAAPTAPAFTNVPGLLDQDDLTTGVANFTVQTVLRDEEAAKLNSDAKAFEHHVDNNKGMAISEVQMRVLSRFNCFIGVHGGNTELAVNFGGHMLLFLHGLPWYDTPQTLERLHGIAGAKITVARNYNEIFLKLPEIVQDSCSKCALL